MQACCGLSLQLLPSNHIVSVSLLAPSLLSAAMIAHTALLLQVPSTWAYAMQRTELALCHPGAIRLEAISSSIMQGTHCARWRDRVPASTGPVCPGNPKRGSIARMGKSSIIWILGKLIEPGSLKWHISSSKLAPRLSLYLPPRPQAQPYSWAEQPNHWPREASRGPRNTFGPPPGPSNGNFYQQPLNGEHG